MDIKKACVAMRLVDVLRSISLIILGWAIDIIGSAYEIT